MYAYLHSNGANRRSEAICGSVVDKEVGVFDLAGRPLSDIRGVVDERGGPLSLVFRIRNGRAHPLLTSRRGSTFWVLGIQYQS